MLADGASADGLGVDFGVPLVATASLVILGGRLYPNLVRWPA